MKRSTVLGCILALMCGVEANALGLGIGEVGFSSSLSEGCHYYYPRECSDGYLGGYFLFNTESGRFEYGAEDIFEVDVWYGSAWASGYTKKISSIDFARINIIDFDPITGSIDIDGMIEFDFRYAYGRVDFSGYSVLTDYDSYDLAGQTSSKYIYTPAIPLPATVWYLISTFVLLSIGRWLKISALSRV